MKKIFFLSLAFIFLSHQSLAQSDPFAAVQQKIATMEQKIQSSGMDAGCFHQFGKDAYPYYKTLVHTPYQQEIETQEKKLSVRFTTQSQSFDDQIAKRLVKPYSQSMLACSENGKIYFENSLKEIMTEKNNLSAAVLSSPSLYKEYGKEYDKMSKESYVFEETQSTWKTLKEKFKALMKGFSSLKTKSSNAWTVSASEKNTISESARSNAIAYRDEFWGNVTNTLFAPLYEERSSILSHLKNLPEKRSNITNVFTGFGGDIFTQKATTTMNEKTNEYLKQTEYEPISIIQSIEQKQKQKEDMQAYQEAILTNAQARQEPERYSESYTQSIIRSLKPAQESIQETTQMMNQSQKALNNRNANQKQE